MSAIYSTGRFSFVIFIIVDRVDVFTIYQQLLLHQELIKYVTVNPDILLV